VITVKKNRFAEFFKGKGYYVLLFVGVIAIAAVAIIGSRLSSSDEGDNGEDFIDLNEPDNNIAADDENDYLLADEFDSSGQTADNNEEGSSFADSGAGQGSEINENLLEYDIYTEAEEQGIDLSENVDKPAADVADKKDEKPKAVETAGSNVRQDTPVMLSFQPDKGLLWPVEGNVIMNYSMDRTIYYATLMQYKCNPAIIIDAEVGTEVKAAATGIVSSIGTNEETGLTVTMDIGDGFKLVYGQLDEDTLELEVGDLVEEGEVVGIIDGPTKYYLVEGSNLYFSVLKDDATVNPMLYLR
jgi:murein DD-endopeptidase MepM/ murein hydrolase activator NlpD